MKLMFVLLFIFSSSFEAVACGLKGASSMQNLLQIAQQTSSDATKALPKVLVNGSSNLIVRNAQGEEVKIDENLVLTPGMVVTSVAGKAQISIPSTGQTVELEPNTTLKIIKHNKSEDQKICNLSFELQAGRAEFTSDHTAREKNCKPTEQDAYEVATKQIEITPVGTKYNVDLNQAIAELNGETYEAEEENVSVKKGSVQIRLVKIKKTRSVAQSKSKKKSIASVDESFEDKPIVVKARGKAKIKKSKKDRMADIQIVYPE